MKEKYWTILLAAFALMAIVGLLARLDIIFAGSFAAEICLPLGLMCMGIALVSRNRFSK